MVNWIQQLMRCSRHTKKNGYLVEVSDKSVKHMHQMIFGRVLSTTKGLHLAKSFGR